MAAELYKCVLFLHILRDVLFTVTGIRIANEAWKACVSCVKGVHYSHTTVRKPEDLTVIAFASVIMLNTKMS